MKIQKLHLQNFMLFQELDTEFSPNINIICGENSTGKTALLKLLYTCARSCGERSKEKLETALVSKLQGVFRPEEGRIGRLVSRRQGNARAEISVFFDHEAVLSFGFGSRQGTHMDILSDILPFPNGTSIYIPPKEIISSTENFGSLYRDYHIAFEETYYDLTLLLEHPLKKGPNTTEQKTVLESFEKILNGSITQQDRKFYLTVSGAGEFEMGLVSEGYRKLATIVYLIRSGSLSKDAVLFWDEPETNMNPKMIPPLVDAIVALAGFGVQVFITTHDYFIQQYFQLRASYPDKKSPPVACRFFSLYKSGSGIDLESADQVSNLSHNTIMEEFDLLYDRELERMYDND